MLRRLSSVLKAISLRKFLFQPPRSQRSKSLRSEIGTAPLSPVCFPDFRATAKADGAKLISRVLWWQKSPEGSSFLRALLGLILPPNLALCIPSWFQMDSGFFLSFLLLTFENSRQHISPDHSQSLMLHGNPFLAV